MVITVFRSRLRQENADEFQALADRMMALAEKMPGFLSYKVYTSDDGERCSIVEFASHEELLAWRNLPEHREAQRLGRERFYESYTLHVTDPVRASRFER
jgi:heme-degrading monooxygenase HmoA